jgi:hypothetical protein
MGLPLTATRSGTSLLRHKLLRIITTTTVRIIQRLRPLFYARSILPLASLWSLKSNMVSVLESFPRLPALCYHHLIDELKGLVQVS